MKLLKSTAAVIIIKTRDDSSKLISVSHASYLSLPSLFNMIFLNENSHPS